MDKELKASRESYWEELDDHGKIERLHRVIKDQESLIRRMTEYLIRLIEHDHLDGKLVQKMSHPGSESYSGFHHRVRDDKWF